jgi:hypothetical protein
VLSIGDCSIMDFDRVAHAPGVLAIASWRSRIFWWPLPSVCGVAEGKIDFCRTPKRTRQMRALGERGNVIAE